MANCAGGGIGNLLSVGGGMKMRAEARTANTELPRMGRRHSRKWLIVSNAHPSELGGPFSLTEVWRRRKSAFSSV